MPQKQTSLAAMGLNLAHWAFFIPILQRRNWEYLNYPSSVSQSSLLQFCNLAASHGHRSPLCTMVQNAGRWCTTHFGGAQRRSPKPTQTHIRTGLGTLPFLL